MTKKSRLESMVSSTKKLFKDPVFQKILGIVSIALALYAAGCATVDNTDYERQLPEPAQMKRTAISAEEETRRLTHPRYSKPIKEKKSYKIELDLDEPGPEI